MPCSGRQPQAPLHPFDIQCLTTDRILPWDGSILGYSSWTVCDSIIKIIWKFFVLRFNDQIRYSNFCMSWSAVMPCTKFWPDDIFISHTGTTYIFTKFWLLAHKKIISRSNKEAMDPVLMTLNGYQDITTNILSLLLLLYAAPYYCRVHETQIMSVAWVRLGFVIKCSHMILHLIPHLPQQSWGYS